MTRKTPTGKFAALLLAITLSAALPGLAALAAADIEEVIVTSQRRDQPLLQHAGNVERIDGATITDVGHQHIHELMSRVAGAWLSRGSGQEHLTAIRSPVLAGAGSCGAYLFLEDGIPIRPSGFCNVNQLFELFTEQAAAIEVIRGPGSALYGSNALHGIINALPPAAGNPADTAFAVETGANDFLRLRADVSGPPQRPWRGAFLYADDGGFRDDAGYRQGKLRLQRSWALADDSRLETVLTATGLDQETAGFITGRDAYRDPSLNRSNPNPEAFREASSLRLYGIWRRPLAPAELDIRPYLRHSRMEFLQHFLPGQPLEENGQVSAGVLLALRLDRPGARLVTGMDIEWADVFLEETQSGPTAGSDFLVETRPAGKHYDFDVQTRAVAPYLQADVDAGERLTVSAGIRLEYVHYDYRNRMLAGNTRDDGTPCGFGGCLYSRPESRSDHFRNWAPKLGFTYQVTEDARLYGNLARGFRAPQVTELYRLQSGQQVADLDSERVDSIELGLRLQRRSAAIDVAAFAMQKRGSVLRDSSGFNVSGGRSRHEGVELALDWQMRDWLVLMLNSSYARHVYDFNRVAARGEMFESGRDVDTAPRWLGGAELAIRPLDGIDVAVAWTSIGDYYLDAENRHRYPGHDLVNVRARVALSPRVSLTARLNNLLDAEYADRADFAFGTYRYFPGRGRELFVELRYRPQAGGN